MRDNLALRDAIEYAVEKHHYQMDKAGKPYILHPLRVMFMLKDESINTQIVGVLHDVVEDCAVSLKWIEIAWGKEVSDAVDSVSRRIFPDGSKELYRDFIQRSKANEIGRKVKLADLADNLSPERLGALEFNEAISMCKKYDKAVAELNREDN